MQQKIIPTFVPSPEILCVPADSVDITYQLVPEETPDVDHDAVGWNPDLWIATWF